MDWRNRRILKLHKAFLLCHNVSIQASCVCEADDAPPNHSIRGKCPYTRPASCSVTKVSTDSGLPDSRFPRPAVSMSRCARPKATVPRSYKLPVVQSCIAQSGMQNAALSLSARCWLKSFEIIYPKLPTRLPHCHHCSPHPTRHHGPLSDLGIPL